MYDVIVVGGGPLGSITSSLIAQNNFKVLLLEKQKHPRWKPCGEGISEGGIQLLRQNKLFEPVRNLLWEITSVSINILQENIVTKKYDKPVAYTLDRGDFDHALFKNAQRKGTKIHENEKVTDIKTINKDEIIVKTTKEKYRSKLIIGADGMNSIVGKKLFRAWRKNEVSPCQVARYKTSDKKTVFNPRAMEYYFIEGGYGWIFPKIKDNKLILNIGIGKINEIKNDLDTIFNNFVELLEHEKKVKLRGKEIDGKILRHPLPTQGPCRGTYSNSCMLVGDAGGFVNPLTGAGLRYGTLSAINAAETAIQFLNNQIDTLAVFEDKWSEAVKHIFNKAMKTREILYNSNPADLIKYMKIKPDLKEELFKTFLAGSS